eukprot:5296989-Pyramimonas_sp.AAC.1
MAYEDGAKRYRDIHHGSRYLSDESPAMARRSCSRADHDAPTGRHPTSCIGGIRAKHHTRQPDTNPA